MQETFYEESSNLRDVKPAKVKYYIFKTVSIISYTLAVIWLILFFNFFTFEGNIFLNLILALLPLAMFIASGILLGKMKERFYVDYDYTFVSGSIRFSKVIKQIKRKHIISFDASDIVKLGEYGSPTFEKFSASPDYKKSILTSNTNAEENKKFYYLAVATKGEKFLFVLECTEEFMVNILKFTGRTVIDEALRK